MFPNNFSDLSKISLTQLPRLHRLFLPAAGQPPAARWRRRQSCVHKKKWPGGGLGQKKSGSNRKWAST